ncbi:hypothetical protein MMC30_005900 [Trapelia coarctata]|nr:hypothetical protein [Trapelia coarctata]
MSGLVHDGSKSLTGRLLGRVKENLEEFVAPQSSFAVNCLAALSKCKNLKHLDLSLICESLQVLDLMRALSTLPKLETFRFPRCSAASKPGMKDEAIPGCRKSCWPDSLRAFYFSCGLQIGYIPAIIKAPLCVTSLTIEEGHSFSSEVVWCSVLILGHQIRSLRLEFTSKFGFEPMNALLHDFPNLTHLLLRADHIGLPFFALGVIPHAHPLKVLTVVASDEKSVYLLMPKYLVEAVNDGRLSNLRTFRFNQMCVGAAAASWEDDIMALADLLEKLGEKDVKDGVADDSVADKAGIWLLDGGSAIERY